MTKIGDEGIDLFNTFELDDDPTYEDTIAAFDVHVAANTNLVFEDHQFLTSVQAPSQSTDVFVLELKKRANKCKFCKEDTQRLICDVLVIGIRDKKVQRDLLNDKDLTLESAVMQQHDSKAISNQVTECNPMPLPVDGVTQEK